MIRAPRYEPLDHGPFAKLHAELTGVQEFEWGSLERRAMAHEPRVRERGRRSFILRALDEQRSLLAFTELLGELCESGAPIEIISSLTRVIRDEARHVDLCDRVVKALGGWGGKVPEPQWVRSDPRLPLRRRILTTVIGALCVGETLSVEMIRGVREHTNDPVVYDVMTRMLADESFHSRFGWWWLADTKLSRGERDFVGDEVRRLLPLAERSVRPQLHDLGKPHVHSPFGSMSAQERDDAFVRAMDRTIVPGFERAGFSVAPLWAAMQTARRETHPCTGPECAADASIGTDGGIPPPPPMCVPEIPECARGEMFLCNTQLDGDGDGWWNHEDCDETRADVHPCAVELCCDDVDSDCDGNLDPLSVACECPGEL